MLCPQRGPAYLTLQDVIVSFHRMGTHRDKASPLYHEGFFCVWDVKGGVVVVLNE